MTPKTDSILSVLNKPQREASMRTEGPVLILAGAGSGKTRTIIHRIAYLIHEKKVPPWRIVALTFTNKAAEEMLNRALEIAGAEASKCVIRTYHSLGFYFLRINAHHLNYPSNFTIWDSSDQRGAIDMILKNRMQKKFGKIQIKYFIQTISSFKDQLVSPEDLLDVIDIEAYEYGDILSSLYTQYEAQKKKALSLDFDDLIYQNVRLFAKMPDVLKSLSEKYQYFMVDEYQDTNRAQYVFIQEMVKKSRNLCVVGDDDQAIYGWRGADVNNILDFQKDFPDAYVVKLEQNYRSTQPILDTANGIIKYNFERMPKKLWTEQKEGDLPYIITLNDPNEEAFLVAQFIQKLSAKTPLQEIAVLYRTNTQSRVVEEAMLTMNIPYRIFGGISFFDRKEVKDTLAYLRFLVNPNDEMSFTRLIAAPSKGIGIKTLQKILEFRDHLSGEKPEEANFLKVMRLASQIKIPARPGKALDFLYGWLSPLHQKVKENIDLIFLLNDILETSGLAKEFAKEDKLLGSHRIENIEELENSLEEFQRNHPNALLEQYLQDIALYTSPQEMHHVSDAVSLMTIHNAKGLEFETVFILSLDQNIIPHYLSIKENSFDEERRLFYVALTRAKKKVYMMRCMRRMQQGFYQDTIPSMFLGEIDESEIPYQVVGS